mmetsp:Transcript_4512/g.4213  ORF Transcript_4512/g.4213 Transcript_4512/m.4213 type:complete len:105 (+) Transcript_4512:296-610(+)
MHNSKQLDSQQQKKNQEFEKAKELLQQEERYFSSYHRELEEERNSRVQSPFHLVSSSPKGIEILSNPLKSNTSDRFGSKDRLQDLFYTASRPQQIGRNIFSAGA